MNKKIDNGYPAIINKFKFVCDEKNYYFITIICYEKNVGGKIYKVFNYIADNDLDAIPNNVSNGLVIEKITGIFEKKSLYNLKYLDTTGYAITLEGINRNMQEICLEKILKNLE